MAGIERATVGQRIDKVSGSIHLLAILVEAHSLIAYGGCRMVNDIAETLQGLRGVSAHLGSVGIAHSSGMSGYRKRVNAKDETILHAGSHIG